MANLHNHQNLPEAWKQLPSRQLLKITEIDLVVYVISACPLVLLGEIEMSQKKNRNCLKNVFLNIKTANNQKQSKNSKQSPIWGINTLLEGGINCCNCPKIPRVFWGGPNFGVFVLNQRIFSQGIFFLGRGFWRISGKPRGGFLPPGHWCRPHTQCEGVNHP